nr:uncharacterized protein LOC117222272 [Megalopta genalis]
MHFVITFGFLISTKFDVNIENENSVALNKKVTKKQQHKKKARGKNNHNNAEIKSNKHNNTEIKPNTVNIGKILAEAHVEYELLPGYTFKFDCRCWETATKIYTENADWCLRPIVHENNLWVVFSIHHEVDLNEVQLQKFFDYVITYQIFPGNNKFYDRAKKDKVKQFYTHANTINIKHNDFLEIYPSELEPITKSKPEPIIVKHETDGEFSIISYLDVIPDNRHQYKFWRMMKKEKFPSEPVTIEFVPSTEVKVPLKSKKLKNMKTQEMTVQMSLTTRNLFSGGLLRLKLSEPLEIRLQQHDLYIGETKKTHRAYVMRTIGLMELTTTMISLSQKCLFPKADAAIAILEDISNHCL